MFFWVPAYQEDPVQYAYQSCIKQVDCDACQMRYYYRMGRLGRGKHQTSFTLSNSRRDKAKASQLAMKQAVWLLGQEAEMVPCPACGHINHELIQGYAHRYRLTAPRGWIAFWLGLFLGVMLAVGLERWVAPMLGWSWGPLSAIAITLGVMGPLYGGLLMRFRRGRLIRQYLDREPDTACQLPVGTPRAMLEDIDDEGRWWLETVIPNEVEEVSAAKGVCLAQAELSFPNICCGCMGAVDGSCTIQLPDEAGAVPLCKSCHRRVFIRQWSIFGLILAAVLMAYGYLFYMMPSSKPMWIVALTFPIAAMGGFAAIYARLDWLMMWLVLPFHFRLVDPHRWIYHFKAKHPLYNLALLEHQLTPQRIEFDPDKDVFTDDIPPQAD